MFTEKGRELTNQTQTSKCDALLCQHKMLALSEKIKSSPKIGKNQCKIRETP